MLERHGVPNAFMKLETQERSRLARESIKSETGHWPGSTALRAPEQRKAAAEKTQETKKRRAEQGIVSPRAQRRIEQLLASIPSGWSEAVFGPLGRISSIKHSCGAVLVKPRGELTCFSCEAPRKAQLQWNLLKELEARFGSKAVLDYRLPSGMQLDIYFPDRKLAVEVNGLNWHGDAAPRSRARTHLQQKVLEAREHGIRLIVLWEDELRDKKELVLGRLAAIFSPVRVGARQCELIEVDPKQARSFLEQHHQDGWTRGASKLLGLQKDGELLMLAALGKPRFGKDRVGLELLRMATKGGFVVQGGISKLIAAAGDEVLTYAALEWGGDGYEAAGGLREGLTQPGYFYYDRNGARRHHRLFLAPSVFEKNTGIPYDTALSEEENAKRVGCFRCYTAGSWRYRFPKR
jgi:hypothetical protein